MPAPTINPSVRPFAVRYGAPAEGPAVVPYNLDFTANAQYAIDMSNLYNQKFLSCILCVYVDNSQNSFPLTVTVADTGQQLKWPGYSQGYLPVMQGTSLKFSVATQGSFIIPIEFLNFPVAPSVWSTNATPIVTAGGAVTVTDPILETAVASGYFKSEKFMVYGDGSINPEFAASKWVTGVLNATTATTIFSGATGWTLKSLKVQLSGDATLAAAGQINVIAAESGGTQITVGRAFLGTAAPANLTPPTTLIDLNGLQLTSKIANSNFQLTANVVPNAGELRYTATYGITNFVGG